MKVLIWTIDELPTIEGDQVVVDTERTDADEIALHLSNDEGQMLSVYWSRESAIEQARLLLNAAK